MNEKPPSASDPWSDLIALCRATLAARLGGEAQADELVSRVLRARHEVRGAEEEAAAAQLLRALRHARKITKGLPLSPLGNLLDSIHADEALEILAGSEGKGRPINGHTRLLASPTVVGAALPDREAAALVLLVRLEEAKREKAKGEKITDNHPRRRKDRRDSAANVLQSAAEGVARTRKTKAFRGAVRRAAELQRAMERKQQREDTPARPAIDRLTEQMDRVMASPLDRVFQLINGPLAIFDRLDKLSRLGLGGRKK